MFTYIKDYTAYTNCLWNRLNYIVCVSFYSRSSQQAYVVDAREQAPSGATEDMYTPAKNVSSTAGIQFVLYVYKSYVALMGGYIIC